MRKMMKSEYHEVKQWLYRNARPLELAVFEYLFENGGKHQVLECLAAFQNEDGGFGHALEADSWNPDSAPYTMTMAIDVLDAIGFEDRNHPLVKGMCRFLDSGVHMKDGKWNFSIPSNDQHAHAPWWTYSKEMNAAAGYNPTGKLAGFILHMAEPDSALYKKVHTLAKDMVTQIMKNKSVKDLEIEDYLYLAETLEHCGTGSDYQLDDWKPLLIAQASAAIEKDPEKWSEYCTRPSMCILGPDSLLYPDNNELVDLEIEYILDTRAKNGIWELHWNWGGTYDHEFAQSRTWWQGYWACRYLTFLTNFDRIEA